MNKVYFVLLLGSFVLTSRAKFITVSTPLGNVTGTVNDGNVASFLGVPYAHPPVNNLRFQLPKFPFEWRSTFNATTYADACHQVTAFAKLPHGQGESEDCLYLNIHIDWTRMNASANLPVVIFIHGGGFIIGSSAEFDYCNLVRGRNIIGVSIQYRLGLLGFAKSPGDLAIPGNLGLHDQVAAIKWVKKYIKYFGGNPDSITLHGQSVGSTSVAFHMFSPLVKDTFQRAIMESGVTETVRLKSDREVGQMMNELMHFVNCKDVDEPFECLRSVQMSSLKEFQNNLTSRGMSFMPTLDSRYFGGNNPLDLERLGNFTTKVESILIGHTGNERGEVLTWMAPNLFPGAKWPTVQHLWKWQMKNAVASTPKEHRGIVDERVLDKLIDRTYENRWTLSPVEVANKLGSMWGEVTSGCPQKKFVENVLKFNTQARVFYFLFSARAEMKKAKFLPYLQGAVHGEELQFVFGKPLEGAFNYTQNEVNFSNSLMDEWAEFVKRGTVKGKQWLPCKFKDEKVHLNHLNYVNSTRKEFKFGFTSDLCEEF